MYGKKNVNEQITKKKYNNFDKGTTKRLLPTKNIRSVQWFTEWDLGITTELSPD